MGIKSRLFASATFPLLSLSLVMSPAHASVTDGGSAVRPVPQVMNGSYDVAQDAPSDEELLKKKRKKAPAAEEQPAQEQQREAAPQQEAPKAEQEAPRRKKREAAPETQQAAPEAQQAQPTENQEQPRRKKREAAPEQAAPETQQAQPSESQEQPRRKKREAAPEQVAPEPQQEQAAPQAEPEQQPAENNVKPRRKQREQQPAQQEAAPQQGEAKPKAEEAQPQTGEAQPEQQLPRKRDKQQQATEGEQPAVKPRAKAATEAQPDQQPVEGKAPVPESSPAPEKAPVPATSPAPEKPPVPAEPDQARKPAGEEQPQQLQGQQAPAEPGATTAEQPAGNAQPTEQAIPAPEKVTPQELERRKQIAEDPSKSTETVVLPVENGAAVLDSDKDADRTAGQGGRRNRDRQRASEQVIAAPKSDADAQLAPEGQRRQPIKIEAVTSEEGRRLDRRPEFTRPEGARVERYEGDDNRIILQFNNRTVVRSDDDRRFLRDGERPIYEQLPRDRYRETIERPEGYRIVTIRNRYGDIVQRSRIDNRGREYVLYYSPELYEDPDRGYFEDPGADLPPMRLGIPVRDYIIDTSSDPDRDYYEFLREPPVEPVERVYSLNEVKYSARIRDKVRRIDLDTITFATGSAEIPMSQARSLRKVADAMNEVLGKDPSETFLIEGHTDAVGSDQSNLVLSDQRAESVANVLSDVYGIPPENLATQGYGERYLKVNTDGPEQENRRVTIRRVTALVRPVASNQ